MEDTITQAENQAGAGFRWLFATGQNNLGFGPDHFPLLKWLETGMATVVKQGPHRVVYRVELPHLTFYVKHNKVGDTRTWLRQLIRPSKARMEYRKAVAVAARGVATVEPLALAERADGLGSGESYFITRSLDETTQLNDFLEQELPTYSEPLRTKIRQTLPNTLGRFIAQLHNAGILHNDLHCGNILIRPQEDHPPTLFLIDLQSVQLLSPLNWTRSRKNLVILNRWLMVRAGRTDRLRFWKAYFASRQLFAGSRDRDLFRHLARQLETLTERSNKYFWLRREQRCRERNRHFRVQREGNLHGRAVVELDPTVLDTLIRQPETPFRTGEARMLKNSRSSAVLEMQAVVNGEVRPVIYKRFSVVKWHSPWMSLFRLSHPSRSWLLGHSLLERGILTPRPLALVQRIRTGIHREGYILMEKVENAVDLKERFELLCKEDANSRRRHLRLWISKLARMIGTMHDRGLSHRDLKAANLLINHPDGEVHSESHEAERIWIIDMVGVSRMKHVDEETRVKNVTRLHASFCKDNRLTRTDKLRFLRAYLRWGLTGKDTWKSWWRQIDSATAQKIEKNRRSGRPLS